MLNKTLFLVTIFVVLFYSEKAFAQLVVEHDIALANGEVNPLSSNVSGTSDFDNPLFKYHNYFIQKMIWKPKMGSVLFNTRQLFHNDCLNFFLDTVNNKNARFSSIIGYLYKSDDYGDSLLKFKKLIKKCVISFNTLGQITFEKVVDSGGRITDSTRMQYNSLHNLIRRTKYSDEDTGKMRMIWDESYIWDDKGRIINYISLSHPSFQNQEFDTAFFFAVYDDINRTITNKLTQATGSTVNTFYKYDNAQRLIQFRFWGESAQTSDYCYKYDSIGNLIGESDIDGGDTSVIKYSYNNKNLRIREDIYSNDSSTFTVYTELLPNGERIETKESFSLYTKMCFRERFEQKYKTVTRYDADSNMLSQIATGERDYKPYYTSIIHKYHFNGRKVILDSSIITERDNNHDSITYAIRLYNSNGNIIENKETTWKGEKEETWKYNRAYKPLVHKAYYTNHTEPDIDQFDYYEDNTTLKKQKVESGYFTAIVTFEKNSLIKSFIFNDIDYEQYVFEYKQ